MGKCQEANLGLRKEGREPCVAEEFLQVSMALVLELDLVVKRVLNLCLRFDFLMLNLTVNSVASF